MEGAMSGDTTAAECRQGMNPTSQIVPSAAQIARALRAPADAVARQWPMLVEAFGFKGIRDQNVLIGAAATVAVECPGWVPIRERKANPAKQPKIAAYQAKYWDSGYFGRGLIQLTGRRNYEAAGRGCNLPLLDQPDLALQPEESAEIFAWFFVQSGAAAACANEDWTLCRRLVNGPGMLHLDRFQAAVKAIQGVMA